MDKMELLESRIKELENLLQFLVKSDRITLQKDLELFEGRNIKVGIDTGTKIGLGATSKLGFFGATPVVQQQGANLVAETGTDQDGTLRAEFNKVRSALINLGLTN